MTNTEDTIHASDFSDTHKGLEWYQCSIERKLLLQLMKKNNWIPLIHNIGQLGFWMATASFALWTFYNLSWPWIVGAVYFHCFFLNFGGGACGHELSHKTMFKTSALNEFFIRINGILFGFGGNYINFRRSHVKHHQFTVHNDLDMEVILPLKLRWYNWIFGFTINIQGMYISIFRYFRYAFGRRREVILKSVWEQRNFPETQPEALKKLVNWARFIVISHLTLVVVFIATGNWILVVIITLGPFIAGWFGLITTMPQHIGMKPDIADWRHNTRTYIAGPIVRFFYWNMNYHVEHHMYPAVPYYNLPKLRKAIENELPIATRGLIATWREVFKILKRQKQNPEYYAELVYPSGSLNNS